MSTAVATANLSQKTAALVALYQLGGYVRGIAPIVDKARQLGLNTDDHHVAHVLWPLSKENMVHFVERKGRGTSVLTNIRITQRGTEKAMELLGMDADGLTGTSRMWKSSVPGTGRAAHAVGTDMTEARNHPAVAVGGPVSKSLQKENPLDSVPFVVLSEEEATHYRAKPVRQQTPRVEEVPSSSTGEDLPFAHTSPPVSAALADGGTDTPPQYPKLDTPQEYSRETARPNAAAFPHIAAVLAKAERVARFTRAAELLGDEEADLAIQILEKVKISPLEEEIIRLLG